LARYFQLKRPVGLHRNRYRQLLPEGLQFFVEIRIEFDCAARNLDLAQRRTLGGYGDFVAVHVVAIGDPKAHFDGRCIAHTRTEGKCLLGRQEILRLHRRRKKA
jgi:hypothetical protein